MEDKFIEMVIKISKTPTVYSFGDKWIYKMCKESEGLLTDPLKLSSVAWIVGRSYAASPERQIQVIVDADGNEKKKNTKKDSKGNKNQEKIEPNEIFEFVGRIVYELRSRIDNVKEMEDYWYDNSESDINILVESISLVCELNFQLRQIYGKFVDSDNMISFCSKFLHFIMPKKVYIIDQYSRNGSKWLFDKGVYNSTLEKPVSQYLTIRKCKDSIKYEGGLYDDVRKNIEVNMKDTIRKINKIKTNGDNNKDIKAIDDYCQHVVNCYYLSKYLNSNNIKGIDILDNGDVSMMRLVDSILLTIGNV